MQKSSANTELTRDLRLDKRFDWVGPPNEISKIRPIRLRQLANETVEERKYREARESLNQWSARFWAHHNSLFERKKEEFLTRKRKNLARLEHSNSVDMSEFYTNFLNDRHDSLIEYNKPPDILTDGDKIKKLSTS